MKGDRYPTDAEVLAAIRELGPLGQWLTLPVLRAAVGGMSDAGKGGVVNWSLHSALNRLARAGAVERSAAWKPPACVRLAGLTTTNRTDTLTT